MLWIRIGICLIFFTVLAPFVCGLPFCKVQKDTTGLSRLFFAYVIGFFSSLALFELICVPMTYARCTFSRFVFVYTCILMIFVILGGVWVWEHEWKCKNNFEKKRLSHDLMVNLRKMTIYEIIYLFLFLMIFGYQVYGAIHYSVTYNSMDDADYIVYATDAIDNNCMFSVDTQTGLFSVFNVKRVFQTSLLYYGYIAKLTGLSVTVVAHTVCCVLFVIMAYMVYWIMAEDIFEKRENRYIFLFLLALIFMFGNYSNYSLTFRLLGPNWQGKAILAVIEIPLLFVILHKLLDDVYKHVYGFLLLILSVAAISLSLMGVGTLMFVMSSIMILGAVLKKKPKLLFYILWGGFFPALVGGLYLLQNK